MPVSLFTGLPGSGKTASLVAEIVRLTEKEPGRPIFQMGINGLKPGFAQELTMEQLQEWTSLPPGSIICIDECQEEHLMPKDRGNPSAWVQAITKVRHHGMQFLLATQHPANMSAYVRRLVDSHTHNVMRAKGVRQTFHWMRCIDDPDARGAKKQAEVSVKGLPKEVFDLYKSSTLHTMKVKTPRSLYLLAALAFGGVVVAFLIYNRAKDVVKPSVASTVAQAAGVSSGSDEFDRLRQKDFAKWSTPRLAGVPWSAPMFDHLSVQAEPKLFCIASDDGRCRCNTEQGTHYDVPVPTCRLMVQNGLYNPFAAPEKQPSQDKEDSPGRTAASPRAPASPKGVQGGGEDVASGGKDRATAVAYVPPTYGNFDAGYNGSSTMK